jgi:RNA polymerase sigma factor (sigma-70 family)
MTRPAPVPLLSAADERDLARAIEAGVVAEHLLETGARPVPASDEELRAVVAAGEHAWRRFLLANLRLVWKLAGREARLSGLAMDELCQEGVVALADTLRRFDVERARFSTFAMVRVRQHLGEVAAARFGDLALPRGQALRLRRARGLESALGQERGRGLTAAELGVELGPRPERILRLLEHQAPVSLDPVRDGPRLAEPAPHDPDADIYATQFRRLLDRIDADQALVLRLRYGLATGEPMDVPTIARRLGLSSSTVRRVERRGLAALRPWAAAFAEPRHQRATG